MCHSLVTSQQLVIFGGSKSERFHQACTLMNQMFNSCLFIEVVYIFPLHSELIDDEVPYFSLLSFSLSACLSGLSVSFPSPNHVRDDPFLRPGSFRDELLPRSPCWWTARDLLCTCSCFLRCALCLNDCPQPGYWQWKFRTFSWTSRTWRTSPSLNANTLWHISQATKVIWTVVETVSAEWDEAC